MNPRLAPLMTSAVIAVVALTACRKEVPTPLPAPDKTPKPTVQASYFAAAQPAAQWLG